MKKISELKIEKVFTAMRDQGLDLRVQIAGKTINLSANVQKLTFIEKGCIWSGTAMNSVAEPSTREEFRDIPGIYYAPFLAALSLYAARNYESELSEESVMAMQSRFVAEFNKKYASTH